MKTHITRLCFTLILWALLTISFAQNYCYEEAFTQNTGEWSLSSSNWSILNDALHFNWAPEIHNFTTSALSPQINLPANTGNLVVNQFFSDFIDDNGETAKIRVVHGNQETDLWVWNTNQHDNWGVPDGQDLVLDVSEYAGQTVQLKFVVTGMNSYLINDWFIFNLKIEGRFANDLKVLSLAGLQTPSMGIDAAYQVAVKNSGSAPQSAYQLRLITVDGTELASVAGANLNANQTQVFTLHWTPFDVQNLALRAQIVLSTDQQPSNNTSLPLEVFVQEAGVSSALVGDGNAVQMIFPQDVYFKNSVTETLYLSSEINSAGGITGLVYYNRYVETLPAQHIRVWLKETTAPNLFNGWIPADQMTLVFDGNVDLPQGNHLIPISFTTPFPYTGAGNLAVMYQRLMSPQVYNHENKFFFTESNLEGRSRYAQHDTTHFNPNNLPDENQICNWLPKTTFLILNQNYGHFAGTVTAANSGQPLADATVTILETGRSATTDAGGHYQIGYVQPGNYTLQASNLGCVDSAVFSATLGQNQTLTHNFTLAPEAIVTLSGHVVASDDTTHVIEHALVQLTGYNLYQTFTDTNGNFNLNVWGNHTYDLIIYQMAYSPHNQVLNLTGQNLNLGTIILQEGAIPPAEVVVDSLGYNNQAIRIDWNFPRPQDRQLIGYHIFRLPMDQMANPEQWTQLNTEMLNETTFLDETWGSVTCGMYFYAVKAVYTGNNISEPAFSPEVPKDMFVSVIINLTTSDLSPIDNAVITLKNLDGNPMFQYNTTTSEPGFRFPSVWKGSYRLRIKMPGYYQYTVDSLSVQQLTVLNIVLNEMPLPPGYLVANEVSQGMDLTWQAPTGTDIGIHESFESGELSPGWTMINTDTEGDVGGYSTNWSVIETFWFIEPPMAPQSGTKQLCLMSGEEHQDEWLITPQIVCPPDLNFMTCTMLGSTQGDHFYVKISLDNGNTWNVVWDAATLPHGWNLYQTPIQIDLSAYQGNMVKIAFHAISGMMHGISYFWLIDNIYTGTPDLRSVSAPLVNKGSAFTARSLTQPEAIRDVISTASEATEAWRNPTAYLVYRFPVGQPEANWSFIHTQAFMDTTFTDMDWLNLPAGEYKYAVKAAYSNGLVSMPAVSRIKYKDMFAACNLAITTNSGDSPSGALVTLTNIDGNPQHVYSAVYPATGSLHWDAIYKGLYNLEITLSHFETFTQENVDLFDDATLQYVLTESLSPVLNLHASHTGNTVNLSWLRPDFGSEQWISWCAEEPCDGLGNGAAAEYDVAIRFEPADIAQQDSLYLTHIKFAPYEGNGTYSVRVWQGGDAIGGYHAGNLVYEQAVPNFTCLEWNDVALNEPVLIDASQELWIGYHINVQQGFPIGVDHNPVVDGKGNLIHWQGTWYKFTDLAPEYAWNFAIMGYAAFDAAGTRNAPLAISTKPRKPKPVLAGNAHPYAKNRCLTGYKVLRDGVLLNQVSGLGFTDNTVPAGTTTLTYQVIAVYTTGESTPVSQTIDITETDDENNPITVTDLLGNYPNPFNPLTTISYTLAQPGRVKLEVFNSKGQLVNVLINKDMPTGLHRAVWNGTDSNRRPVGNGVYFSRLSVGKTVRNQKMVLLK